MRRLQKAEAEAPVAPSGEMDLFSRGGCPGARGVAGEEVVKASSTPRAVSSPHGAEAAEPATPHVPDNPGAGEAGGLPVCSDGASARRSTTPPPLGRGEPVAGGILPVAPAPTAHHPHGMSRWPAVLACPCFEGKDGGADAELGTGVHAFLATLLEALRLHGRLPEVEPEGLSFHEAGAWRAARWVAETLEEEVVSPRALRVEERVSLFDAARKEHVFGTADCLWVHGQTVTVVDFKTFYNPGRDHIAQLAGYGYAAACASRTEVTHIRCVVAYGDHALIEPRALTKAEAGELCAQALAAFGSGGEPRQCAWCELCARCAACRACVATVSRVATVDAVERVAETWAGLASTRKAQLLVVAEFAGKWAEAVRSAAKADLERGEAIADPEHGIAYALRETRARLRLDCDALWQAAKARGVSAQAFRGCLRPDAAEAKRVLREAGLAAKAADALLESCGTRGAPSLVLARA